MREDSGYADLSEIRGFSTHVRTGEKEEVFIRGKVTIVWNELLV